MNQAKYSDMKTITGPIYKIGALAIISLSASFSVFAETPPNKPSVNKGATMTDKAAKYSLPLTTFNELKLHINADSKTLWELIRKRSLWMETLRDETTVSGVVGEVGHVASVTTHVQGKNFTRIEEVIVAEPSKRLILKATTSEPYTSTTFIDYTLNDLAPNKTELKLNIYLSADLIMPEEPSPKIAMKIREQAEVGTQAKIQKDHAKLKILAEKKGG